MFTPYETELFKDVASSPLEGPRYLVSINIEGRWFASKLAGDVFSAIARDALMDKATSFVSIISQFQHTPQEREYLKGLWLEGRAQGERDIKSTVEVLRNESLHRCVSESWTLYNKKLAERPTAVRDHINDLGAELAVISHDGVGYDPDPTTHYGDAGITVGTSWKCSTIDKLYGGVLNGGYALFVAKTGFGKSTWGRSVAAYSIVRSVMGERTLVALMLNEMDAGETSRRLRDSLRDMWAGTRSDTDIDNDIKTHSLIFEEMYSMSKLEHYLYWFRPQVAIVDSLDALDFPSGTSKFSEVAQHQARAIKLHDLSRKYGCFIVIPSNASGQNQKELGDGNLDKITQAQAFNSMWYEGKANIATVMTWDRENFNTSLFKNTKHRPMGQIMVGNVVSMVHSGHGGYYRDPVLINLNQ